MLNKNVSSEMGPYIASVLARDMIPYSITEEGKDSWNFEIECTEDRYVEVEEDAECEVQRDSTMHHTPVYSYRTLKDTKKKDRLIAINRKKCFQVLKKDKERADRDFLDD